ncbi:MULTISPECIES: hypothetical protein [unclassified Ectothiorhodospira]|uniref:hypothetical protein n=1 Tax=unclassified Ectothiorhodospira TaxID=2684909 RepID=UPI001EE8E28C|nr:MULTISPECIES: hypothetical protein [unclassified Ectothiorhodospira]MCG5516413.1 hypothetical protein [Ectothiorhodospira sp. 9100]MCG5519337.1 hypothetical protein [Ectothiorhodospira sp. 9905]
MRKQGGIERLEKFTRVYRPSGDATSQLLKGLVAHNQWELAREWFLAHLQEFPPGSARATEACIEWFEATADLKDMFAMACTSPSGPQLEPEDILKSLADAAVDSTREGAYWGTQVIQNLEGAHSLKALLVRTLLEGSSRDHSKRRALEPGALQQALIMVFGSDEGERLLARFEEQKRTSLDSLNALKDTMASITEEADEVKGGTDEEESEGDESILPVFAQSLYRAWTSVKELTNEKACSLGGAVVSVTRRLLFSECASRHLALTDTAWDWIEKEQDVDILMVLLTLVLISSHELHFCTARACVMNSKHRCQIVVSALAELSRTES